MERIKLTKELELPPGFKPSPTMRVSVGEGKVVAMNRRTRRRLGIGVKHA